MDLNNSVFSELFSIKGLNIVSEGTGVIEYIQVGNIRFGGNCYAPAEAMFRALVFFKEELAKKEERERILKAINNESGPS